MNAERTPIRVVVGAGFAAVLTFISAGALVRGTALVCEASRPDPREALVPQGLGRLSDKFRAFAANKDKYTGLFIGTSSVYRDIIPEVVDRELPPGDARSFNFGAPSMSLAESSLLISAILALEPARLRWMVIDDAQPEDWDGNLFTPQYLYWHTWEETRLLSRSIWSEEAPLVDRISRSLPHWSAFALHAVETGSHAAIIRSRLGIDLSPPRPMENDGYRALDLDPDERQRHVDLLDHPAAYQAAVAKLRQHRKRVPNAYRVMMLSRMREKVEASGVVPVFFAPPSPWNQWELPPSLSGVVTLYFNDPDRYPELFAIENRFDRGHLNDRGAHLLSESLGRALAERIDVR